MLAVLFVAASGWRPRFTALPLWWILFSDQASFTLVDGGDQIAAVLALLLIPISLTDSRKWHWMRSSQQFGRPRKLAVTVARVSRGVICVQVAFIYLDACLSKLSVPEWVDGTAGYYWLQDPMFGPAGVLRTISNTLMLNPLLVTAMTWGTLVIEFSLGVALLLSARHRAILFPIGLLFHLGIALTMGLWSFVFVMWAALALYLRAEGDFPAEWLSAFRRSRSRSREARRCSVARG
ncbi:hypothetical protein AX769_07920 [Frondihabitans sp. PAMC 28766]|nr:hypothetical protein AX769_07920 [Frondihabitans sp. PAMC 28766]